MTYSIAHALALQYATADENKVFKKAELVRESAPLRQDTEIKDDQKHDPKRKKNVNPRFDSKFDKYTLLRVPRK